MNYLNPELLRRLAAEYSLGTLRGPARKRFEELLETEPEAREHVNFWDWRLSEFGQAIDPVSPPASARAELLAFIAPAPGTAVPRASTASAGSRIWRRSARRLLAGMAAAASLVLAFQIGRHNSAATSALAQRATDATVPAPIYVAKLGMPASSMQWLISLSPDRQKLMVVADDDFLTVGRFKAQLWGTSARAGAIRLGTLPVTRDGLVAMPLPEALRGEDHATFAITLEPNDSASGDHPAGPILSSAKNLDEI